MRCGVRYSTWRSARNLLAALALGGGGGGYLVASKRRKDWALSTPLAAAAAAPRLSRHFLQAESRKGGPEVAPQPTATWDFNWDKRDPGCLVRPPPKAGATEEQLAARGSKLERATPTAKRVLVLVRHGQYNMAGKQDSERRLSPLGREQADATGARLAALRKSHDKPDPNNNNSKQRIETTLVMSTMTRATETANIILEHFSGVRRGSCDLIREGAPCQPVPDVAPGLWDPEPHAFFEEGARIEAGFRKYFHRANPSQAEDSFEILVCHGNVIRYFLCRALQLPPQAWLRFAVHNGSYTVITILPTGRVSVSAVGESGHMPVDKLTFN